MSGPGWRRPAAQGTVPGSARPVPTAVPGSDLRYCKPPGRGGVLRVSESLRRLASGALPAPPRPASPAALRVLRHLPSQEAWPRADDQGRRAAGATSRPPPGALQATLGPARLLVSSGGDGARQLGVMREAGGPPPPAASASGHRAGASGMPRPCLVWTRDSELLWLRPTPSARDARAVHDTTGGVRISHLLLRDDHPQTQQLRKSQGPDITAKPPAGAGPLPSEAAKPPLPGMWLGREGPACPGAARNRGLCFSAVRGRRRQGGS